MSLFRKLFGDKTPEPPPSAPGPASQAAPGGDPSLIRVFDGYGREMFLTRQQWRDFGLLANLKKVKADPERLYDILVAALQEGFAPDVVPYAEHLWRTDPVPSRGATILGIVYLQVNRLEDAQRVLEGFLAAHGEDGVVLTNLAKVYSQRGDPARAESLLWRALEVDPNQDNGLVWYAAIQRERGGDAAELDAFRRIAALPGSWRAQVWLARDALRRKDPAAAESLYAEALARAGHPVPWDLLTQMSGDLGNHGYMAEMVRLVEPQFDVIVHGLLVGNNLIKAHLNLGRIGAARHVLDQLYAQNRPDWQETLRFWDAELARAEVARRAATVPEQFAATVMSIEGPLWTRDGSPFASLLPAKHPEARRIAVFGSTVLLAGAPESPSLQLADAPGQLSRAVPLLLAEQIHLVTDAVGIALIPWAQNRGFLLFERPYEDPALATLAGQSGGAPALVAGIVLDTTGSPWKLALHLLQVADGRRIAETEIDASGENAGPAVAQLSGRLMQMLITHAGVHATMAPEWYQVPAGEDLSDYLLRLEQQLAVASLHLDALEGGGLSGERAILDGTLYLCLRQPQNPTVRMLLAQTLRQMQKVRPEILSEYTGKIDLLRRDYPLAGDVAALIDKAVAAVFAR